MIQSSKEIFLQDENFRNQFSGGQSNQFPDPYAQNAPFHVQSQGGRGGGYNQFHPGGVGGYNQVIIFSVYKKAFITSFCEFITQTNKFKIYFFCRESGFK